MKFLRKYKFPIIKAIIFGGCFFFIFSSFNAKLSIIKFSKIIEIFNGDFYSNLSELSISDYHFSYDCNDSKNDISSVINIIENNTTSLQMLNLKNIEKPQIKILSQFNERYSESLGYVYFHNNVITILNRNALLDASNVDIDSKFLELVSHEYTHFLINCKLKENKLFPKVLPLWFNEGIAEYIGILSRNGYIPDHLDTTIKLSELNNIFNDNPDLFYEQSVIFISYLVKNYGYESIGLILDSLRENNFEKSIQLITGKTLDEISYNIYKLPY